MTNKRGGTRPGAGHPFNTIPSHRVVVNATDDEMTQIKALSPRERTDAMMKQDYGYPFGYAERGLVEVAAGCPGCQDERQQQQGHFYCNPIDDERIVVGPILTSAGWRALVKPE